MVRAATLRQEAIEVDEFVLGPSASNEQCPFLCQTCRHVSTASHRIASNELR